jgi:ribose transport system substrate-binding protein
MRKPVLTLALLALGSLQLTGCQYRSKNDTYILVAPNLKLPYWKTVQAGFNQAALDYHVTARIEGPDTYDPKGEEDALNTAVRANPAGILISAADAGAVTEGIRAANRAGIPIITVDSDAPYSARLFFIGTNNLEAGHVGGRRLAERLGGRGNVVIYSIPGQPNLEDRLKGYRDALAESPGIKIVDVTSTRSDSGNAFDRTEQYLALSGANKIDAFVSLESTSGNAIAEVLNRHKITDRVVIAMDVDADTLKYIDDGTIDATISQKPFSMGYIGLRELDLIHHDPHHNFKPTYATDIRAPFPAFIDTGSTLITKLNVAAFQQAMQQ